MQLHPLVGKSYMYHRPIAVTQIRAHLKRQQAALQQKVPLTGLHVPSPDNSLDGSFLLYCCFVGISDMLEFVLQQLCDGSSFPPSGVTCISDNGRNIYF